MKHTLTSNCAADGCCKPIRAKGLCATHYWRLQHHGSTDKPPKRPKPPRDRLYHIDIAGQTFGRLTAVEYVRFDGQHARWRCRCECGGEITTTGRSLRAGGTQSCGCLRLERLREKVATHGMTNTRAMKAWKNMIARCHYQSTRHWHRYGGRGITVCQEWVSFDRFFADMGDPPPGMSLDRIDNDGNYCKENCRWATHSRQVRNSTTATQVLFDGEMVALLDLCDRYSTVTIKTVQRRINKLGWPVEKALMTPSLR